MIGRALFLVFFALIFIMLFVFFSLIFILLSVLSAGVFMVVLFMKPPYLEDLSSTEGDPVGDADIKYGQMAE